MSTTTAQTAQAEATASRLGWRHWLYFTLLAAILLADGMDVTIVSHTFPSLIQEWGVDIGGGIALVVTIGYLAMGLGAIVGGRLADRFGRKIVIVIAAAIMSIGTALGATAADFGQFTAWRVFASLGIGAVMPLAITLLADLVPERRRGAMVAAGYAAVGLGTTVGAALAAMLIPTQGWRSLMIAGGVIPLVIIVLLAVIVPESPAFYFARGRREKAQALLAKLDPAADLDAVAVPRESARPQRREALTAILAPPRRWTTLLLWVFGFFSLGTQLLIAQYLPTLLQLPVPGLDTVQSSTVVGWYGFASVLGAIVLGLVLGRASRFWVIGTNLVLAAVMLLVVALVPNPGFETLLPLLTVFAFIVPTAVGPTRNVLAVNAYPAEIRATGVGATELSARLGSATGGALGGTLIGAGLGISGVMLVLLVPIAILLMSLLGIGMQSRR